MTGHETVFEELVLTEVLNRGIDNLDFTALPPEIGGILELTHPNLADRIRYLARNSLQELSMIGKFSWIGLTRTVMGDRPTLIIVPNTDPEIEIEDSERQIVRDTIKLLASVTEPAVRIGILYMSSPAGTEYGECAKIKVRSDFGMAELIWESNPVSLPS